MRIGERDGALATSANNHETPSSGDLMNKKLRRGKVFLEAIAGDGSIVERREVAYGDYYDGGSLPLIDCDQYRASRGIRKLRGDIFDSTGSLMQRFENDYDDDGAYIGGVAVHNDGTVVDHRQGK